MIFIEIFFCGRFFLIMNILKGVLGFVKEGISYSVVDKKDGELLILFL